VPKDTKLKGYDAHIKEQTRMPANPKPAQSDSRAFKQSDNYLFDSVQPNAKPYGPSGGVYRPPSSQNSSNGRSLGGAGRAVLSNPEEESRRLAQQMQEQFDREANEDYLGRQQVKDRQKISSRQADDERIARELQEQMDRELARKIAEEADSPVREAPVPRRDYGAQGSRDQGLFGDIHRRLDQGFGGGFDDDYHTFGAGDRPGTQGRDAQVYGGYGTSGNAQPKYPGTTSYGYTNPSYPQNPDLEDDEEYQRVLLESLKDNSKGVKKYR
jgi:hypothetical protein